MGGGAEVNNSKLLFSCFDLNFRKNIIFDIFWGGIIFFRGAEGSLIPFFFA